MTDIDGALQWSSALKAAAVLALDPSAVGGLRVRACAGPVRDAWMDALRRFCGARRIVKMPASIDVERLIGGLDLAGTLAARRPVGMRGLLADAHGGIVIAAMAERLPPVTIATLGSVLDQGVVMVERDGLSFTEPALIGIVALDEGIDDEALSPSLADRLAMGVDLTGIAVKDAVPPSEDFVRATEAAQRVLSTVATNDDTLSAFARVADALGIVSLRPPMAALAVTRALAAIAGRMSANEDDARDAAALVLAWRATRMPANADDEEQSPPQQGDEGNQAEQQTDAASRIEDVVLDAVQTALPPGLLAKLAASDARTRGQDRGKAGARQANARRGRRLPARSGSHRGSSRLDVVATLRAAAPFQALRGAEARIAIRPGDLRMARFEERASTITIFLVDASGSAARERLAEAKGAVRLMLADCYIRRDEVAFIVFRNAGADLALPPTRSLVRAQRALAALPGGGGTPLAAGLEAATNVARAEAAKGRTPSLVVMSDGRANVARDGTGGRPRAHEDALSAAKAWRANRWAAAFVDTSATPNALAEAIALAMDARYVRLPYADARGVDNALRTIDTRPR